MIIRTRTKPAQFSFLSHFSESLFFEMFSNLTLKWIYPVMSVINLYSLIHCSVY